MESYYQKGGPRKTENMIEFPIMQGIEYKFLDNKPSVLKLRVNLRRDSALLLSPISILNEIIEAKDRINRSSVNKVYKAGRKYLRLLTNTV